MVVVNDGALNAQNMLLFPSNYDRYSADERCNCHILLTMTMTMTIFYLTIFYK